MRDVAVRFNTRFGETLVVTEIRVPKIGARIGDLQEPEKKRSTTAASEAGTVYVLDEPDAVVKKFKRAVTDSGPDIVRAPDKPGVTNLLDIYAAVRRIGPEQAEADFADARGYGDLKTAVAEAVVEHLSPIRERYAQLRPDEAALEEVLALGAAKAREIAAATLTDVRARMGVGAPV